MPKKTKITRKPKRSKKAGGKKAKRPVAGAAAGSDKRIARFNNELKKIIDPHTGVNIVDMKLVKEMKANRDTVSLVFIPTSPFCPLVQYFVAAMEKSAQKAGFKRCNVTVKGCD